MDRFLVKRNLGDLMGEGEEPATQGADPGISRKKPRREAAGSASPMSSPSWRHIRSDGLSCDYTVLFGKAEADEIFRELEEEVDYFTGRQRTLGVETN